MGRGRRQTNAAGGQQIPLGNSFRAPKIQPLLDVSALNAGSSHCAVCLRSLVDVPGRQILRVNGRLTCGSFDCREEAQELVPVASDITSLSFFDPDYNQEAECLLCDHSYQRHFDSYEPEAPPGCKYCPCLAFAAPAAEVSV